MKEIIEDFISKQQNEVTRQIEQGIIEGLKLRGFELAL